jgi:uncharacterized protein with HEPN domain
LTGRSTDPRVLLDDMVRYTATIARWVAKGHAVFQDEETGCQATIERQLEQFEEAANRLGKSFRESNPGIPWGPVFELRNDLSHPYERSYDREKLWRFVRDELPAISRKLRRPKFPKEKGPTRG